MTQKDIEYAKPPLKETLFQGKQIVITGGASGIGKALAERFSQLGAAVKVVDISESSELPENVVQIKADVADLVMLQSQLEDQNIDVLIIAAGVTSQTNEPTETEKALMDAVNVTGVQNTLESITSLLTTNAQVVYVGSDDPPKAYYAETKRKGAQFVKEFAESHPDISTRIIYLGPVRTPLFEKGKPPEVIQRIEKNVGLYEPSEFAEELIDDLVQQVQTSSGLQEKVMYKQVKVE